MINESLSSFFTVSTTDSTAPSLSALFSENSKAKFERSFKPEELVPRKKEPRENEKKKKKKRKHIESIAQTDIPESSTEPLPAQSISEADRTVFVGNIAIAETQKSIKRIFSDCGEVESVRLRSVPIGNSYNLFQIKKFTLSKSVL